MKKKLAMFTLISLMSSNGFAFTSVTEVLPNGKLLICKKSGQVKNGERVENHKRADAKSSSDYSTVKTSDFKLPTVGQKVKLTHKDFHSTGKKSTYHTQELGTATITDQSLEGEERISYTLDKSRHSRRIKNVVKISKEDAAELQANCLVAIPDNGLKLEERAAVSWE
jgi:hypothetical protein